MGKRYSDRFNRIDPDQLQILRDNQDPYADSTPSRNKRTKNKTKSNKKKRPLFNSNNHHQSYLMNSPNLQKHPKKKRKMSGIQSITSNSSSDLEILNNNIDN